MVSVAAAHAAELLEKRECCDPPAVDESQPCASSGQSVRTAEVVELPLQPADANASLCSEADAANDASDASDGELDGPPARKFRKLSCTEPPPQAKVRSALRPVLAARGAVFLPTSAPGTAGAAAAVEAFISAAVAAEAPEDNFYVYDLAVVEALYRAWTEAMPRVHPFYAVKCNPDDGILAVLAALGAGFDCASEAEIAQVMALGVDPSRVVYAHPVKPPRQIKWAAAHGVNLTTFDTESELAKMAEHHAASGLLLRIRADDPNARCQLGNKYGAEMGDVPHLLATAHSLGLAVRGVSFHVGSGAKNPAAFTAAIEAARKAFNMGLALGFEMDTLDIGGGFCGGSFGPDGAVDLGGVPAAVNAALDAHFPADGTLRVLAEPGRYFAEAAATYACYINGWRARAEGGGEAGAGGPPAMDYFLTDGLYGSMNCLVYDHADLQPKGMRSPLLPSGEGSDEDAGPAVMHPTTLFGPTCDGLDTIARDVPMPRLRNGDWVLFPKFGAYTIAGAVNFNGFDVVGAKVHYVYTMKP